MNDTVVVPGEVLAFLRSASDLNDDALGINILSPEQCAVQTAAIRGIPAWDPLELFVLDDADDSNPFCLVTRGPAAGMVMHLIHDSDEHFSFVSLAAFRTHLVELKEAGSEMWRMVGDFEPDLPLVPEVGDDIDRLLVDQGDETAEWLICRYLQLAPLDDLERMQALADHTSIYVREALAGEICRRPAGNLVNVAGSLFMDRNAQVARLGKQALRAAMRLRCEDRRLSSESEATEDVDDDQEFEGVFVAHWEIARFAVVRGRRLFGLLPRLENWGPHFPPDFELPHEIARRSPMRYYRMRLRGYLGPKGRYGHKGIWSREFFVTKVLVCEETDRAGHAW